MLLGFTANDAIVTLVGLTSGTYTEGHSVTQAVSNATGTVYATVTGTSVIVNTTSGTFVKDEIVTINSVASGTPNYISDSGVKSSLSIGAEIQGLLVFVDERLDEGTANSGSAAEVVALNQQITVLQGTITAKEALLVRIKEELADLLNEANPGSEC